MRAASELRAHGERVIAQKALTETQVKLVGANNEKTALQAQLDLFKQNNTDLLMKYNNLFAEKAALENQVTSITSEKAALENQVTSITSEKAALENQVTSLTSEKAALENQVTSLTSEKVALDSQVTSLKASNIQPNQAVDDAHKQMHDMQSELEDDFILVKAKAKDSVNEAAIKSAISQASVDGNLTEQEITQIFDSFTIVNNNDLASATTNTEQINVVKAANANDSTQESQIKTWLAGTSGMVSSSQEVSSCLADFTFIENYDLTNL